MPWDDLHEPKGPQERFKPSGGRPQGGGEPPKPGGGPNLEIPNFKFPKMQPSAIIVAVIVLLGIWIIPGMFFFVEPDQQGVVVRFGKYSRSVEPGMHFKFPSPIEHVYRPQVLKVQRTEIGFRSQTSGSTRKERDVIAESLMLTGDQNLVDLDLVIQYKIKDASDYLFNIRRQSKLVRNAGESIIRRVVGERKIDEALTTGKSEIQIQVKEQVQALLDRYQSGIQIVAAQLKDAHPPSHVAAAFKDVVSAREDKERSINEAQGYRNAIIPEARGRASKIIREAEGYQQEKVKRAKGDVHRFLAQYKEYKKAPDITRKRIYLETMEEILPEMDKYVMGNKNGGNVLPILPLGKSPIPGMTQQVNPK